MLDVERRHPENFDAPLGMVDRSPQFAGDGNPVSFGRAIARGLWRSSVYGRASRSEFWFFWLFCMLLRTTSLVLFYGVLDTPRPDTWLSGFIAIFVTTVFIRRLHDVGRSGWWVLLSFTIIGVIPLFIWSIRKGDPHPNRFDLRDRGQHQQAVDSAAAALDQVERLHRLRANGVINEDEFRALKKRAL